MHEFPNAVSFAGQLVFSDELDGCFNRFLHNHTALDLLRWLQLRGLSLGILPIRVSSPITVPAKRERSTAEAALGRMPDPLVAAAEGFEPKVASSERRTG